jgi:hypothetical protein
LATVTLYRPIGTAELALLERALWRAFPAMPQGHKFYAYTSPPEDVLAWKERSMKIDDFPEVGQGEIVRSWEAWGNSPSCAFIVAFELDEQSPLRKSEWNDRSYEVDEINAALVGAISLHTPSE